VNSEAKDGRVLDSMNVSHRAFALPLLRAVEELGGEARPSAVKAAMRAMLSPHLNTAQLDYLAEKSRFGWVRLDLKHRGLIDGERGRWRLTELGRRCLEQYRGETIAMPPDLQIGSASAEEVQPSSTTPSTADLESVDATHFDAYEVPLLEALGTGTNDKAAIMERTLARVSRTLLPGDRRVMGNGREVWRYRASWALSSLKLKGEAQNLGRGKWAITEEGRRRLEKKPGWDIESFRGSKAQVRLAGDAVEFANDAGLREPEAEREWDPGRWKALEGTVSTALWKSLEGRLRTDLGPTPQQQRRLPPRNWKDASCARYWSCTH
jgi:5-methylcytosine-specific restriction protein B